MRIKLQTTSLQETTGLEYLKRFIFGGLVTVAATLVAEKWGPVVGGMFLAFPGIFPASVSLVEKHKIQRERDRGNAGVVSARGEASIESAGASAGALGLAAFAFVIWKETTHHPLGLTLACAAVAWAVVSWIAWFIREKRSVLNRVNRERTIFPQ